MLVYWKERRIEQGTMTDGVNRSHTSRPPRRLRRQHKMPLSIVVTSIYSRWPPVASRAACHPSASRSSRCTPHGPPIPLDDPYHVMNWSSALDIQRAVQVQDRRSPRRNMRPIGRFPGEFVGYSMQTTNPLLDTTDVMDPMKRIENLWTSSIPSASFLLRPHDVPDSFAQVSAQGNVSLPGRCPSMAYN